MKRKKYLITLIQNKKMYFDQIHHQNSYRHSKTKLHSTPPLLFNPNSILTQYHPPHPYLLKILKIKINHKMRTTHENLTKSSYSNPMKKNKSFILKSVNNLFNHLNNKNNLSKLEHFANTAEIYVI